MMKRKTLFYTIFCAMVCGGVLAIANHIPHTIGISHTSHIPTTKYGAYLATQHAVYVNDFDAAAKFIDEFADIEYPSVESTRVLAEFLAGNIPDNIDSIAKDKNAVSKFIYDAHLAKNEKWSELYKRYSSDKSALYSSLRIWSGIATQHTTDALKYLDSLESNPSWKAFIRGQIYIEQGDISKAADAFNDVKIEFININDYMYLMSFYTANNMAERASQLRDEFISTPGGMFMADFDNFPDFAVYRGIKNQLAFNLVQHVSHTPIMLYSDISILMLRFAQIIGPDAQFFQDVCNYYAGHFFANTRGNYEKSFDMIDQSSPFHLFATMRKAGDKGSISDLRNILDKQPLFIPVLNKLVATYTAQGNKKAALRVINRAFKNKNLPDSGRAYLLKRRASVYLLFGDFNRAQTDIREAVKLSSIDYEVLTIQSRIWAAQGRELENAYDYAMTLVKQDPLDVVAWDTVAVVVAKREGNDAALEILRHVGGSANTCSSLFEHLGDAYVKSGQSSLARDAYLRAIELSDDGFSIVPQIRRKLEKIK